MEFLDGIINMRLKPSDEEKLIQKANEKHLRVLPFAVSTRLLTLAESI